MTSMPGTMVSVARSSRCTSAPSPAYSAGGRAPAGLRDGRNGGLTLIQRRSEVVRFRGRSDRDRAASGSDSPHEGRSRHPRLDAELAVNVLEVLFHGSPAQLEDGSGLRVGLAL